MREHIDTAKVFMSGRSQAVRLPAAYRFDVDEVFIRRDEVTGDLVLSARPANWDGLFAVINPALVPDGFLDPSGRQQPSPARDPLAGVVEP